MTLTNVATHAVTLTLLFCSQFKPSASYKIYTVEDPNVCNKSIYLEQGANSAAILKLTSKLRYSTRPLYCTIKFKAPLHNWSGLTGILEEVDLRRYEDNGHHLGQSVCVDHITVMTEKPNSIPNEKQCGSWSIIPGQPLSRLGYNRALVGSCPHSNILGNEKCHVTELQVIVSVGNEENSYLWKNTSWPPHRGFTFVVTAYSYPIKNGESECRDGLRSCSEVDSLGAKLGVHHCVHHSLWCDGHINCGLLENMDELSCTKKGIWNGLMTVVIGPWMGASMFLIMSFCGILYYRSSRDRLMTLEAQNANQEVNSYAESYELSSNLSSAHHMAIQVRVVCNSNHPHHNSRGAHQPWKNDLPPSYDTLFPQGPPQSYSPITSITATVSPGASSGNTMNAVGLNVSSTVSLPSALPSTSGNREIGTTANSETTPNLSSSRTSTTGITSIIDLNFSSNNISSNVDNSSFREPQASIESSSTSTTSDETSRTVSNSTSSVGVNFKGNKVQSSSFVSKSPEPSSLSGVDTNASITSTSNETSVTLTLHPGNTCDNNSQTLEPNVGNSLNIATNDEAGPCERHLSFKQEEELVKNTFDKRGNFNSTEIDCLPEAEKDIAMDLER